MIKMCLQQQPQRNVITLEITTHCVVRLLVRSQTLLIQGGEVRARRCSFTKMVVCGRKLKSISQADLTLMLELRLNIL
jgi:hypothetical protein